MLRARRIACCRFSVPVRFACQLVVSSSAHGSSMIAPTWIGSSRPGRCLRYLFQSRLHRSCDTAAPVSSEPDRRHKKHSSDLQAHRYVDGRLVGSIGRSIAGSSDYHNTTIAVAFMLELMYGRRHVLSRRLSSGHPRQKATLLPKQECK
jgi:hypothetical protein